MPSSAFYVPLTVLSPNNLTCARSEGLVAVKALLVWPDVLGFIEKAFYVAMSSASSMVMVVASATAVVIEVCGDIFHVDYSNYYNLRGYIQRSLAPVWLWWRFV